MLDANDVKNSMDQKKQRHYVGTCVDNADPLQLGRIKVRVPEIYGEIPCDHLPWCNPASPFGGSEGENVDGPYGFFFIPMPGAKVRIVLWRNHPWFPIWTGIHWTEGQTPEESKLTPPTNYVLKTPKQHLMDFNDTESSSYMRLKDFRGNFFIIHTTEDNILAYCQEDYRVKVGNNHDETCEGNRRIRIVGNLDIDVDGEVNINAGGNVNIDGADIHLNSGNANPAQPEEPEDVEIQ